MTKLLILQKRNALTTKNAVEILNRLTGDDAELREMIAVEKARAQTARKLHQARIEAGLIQRDRES